RRAPAKLRDPPPPQAERLDFGSQREVFALRRVSGNILSADVDLSHPLAFGLEDRRLLVNKETGLVFENSTNPYLNVVRIDDRPRVNGDVPPSLSSRSIWSPIPNQTEIGREEALFRRADHRLPA